MNNGAAYKLKVLLSAYKMDKCGVSESYLSYKWFEYLSKRFELNVVTTSSVDASGVFCEKIPLNMSGRFAKKINDAIKIDYFLFNRAISRKYKNLVMEADILHHVSPVGPRYPVSLSKFSKRFVLGPVGGGLRVPLDFRAEVEASEDWFSKLRNFDKIRFSLDRNLKYTYDRADIILCAGEYMKDVLPVKYQNKMHSFLDVGVELDDYDFFNRVYRGGVLNLLYVGRVVPYKGLIYLLKAISLLSDLEKKNISLTVVGFKGESPYEKEIYRYIENNKLKDIVTLVGYVPKEIALTYYKAADIFCFPSLAEAGGTVVLEAMANGLPVLAAKVGGPVTSISSDSGILVNCTYRDEFIEDLRSAISSVLNGNICISTLSYAARKRVEEHFTWNARLEKISGIYESIV